MPMPRPRARSSDLLIRPLEDELLVYDLAGHEAHCLNRPAALVWERCDGKRTVAELAALLQTELGDHVDEDVVRAALAELDRRGLLDEDRASDWAPRLTRRQLLRRLGAAAAVALPVVTSLEAPTAAQAASCLGLGAHCNNSSECCGILVCAFGLCA
jgi:hypothetical protein